MHIQLPQEVKTIIATLEAHGYEAYAVGGCVRDSVLGRTPDDWDITTSAKPEEVKKVFKRTIDTGIEHGTVTVRQKGKSYEVTTYRIDGEYADARHPDEVIYTDKLDEDLKRRDFTINAMAYSDSRGLVDNYGGMSDIRESIIRCVGNPTERFTEDALRILRAVRFSAQLGFAIEEGTWSAVVNLAPNMVHVSKERIFTEINKTLMSVHPENIRKLWEADAAGYIADGFEEIYLPIGMSKAALLKKERYIRWAALLSQMDSSFSGGILKELKSDNDTKDKCNILITEIKREIETNEIYLRKLLATRGLTMVEDIISLDRLGFGQNKGNLDVIKSKIDTIINRGDCISLSSMKMTGSDLINLGMKPGPELGATLNKLFECVLEHPELNEYDKLKGLI